MEKIVIDKRKYMEITETKEIDEYGEKEIKLTLLDGVRLSVLGSNLKIVSFSKESGNLVLNGGIFEVKYKQKSTSFLKRVFK